MYAARWNESVWRVECGVKIKRMMTLADSLGHNVKAFFNSTLHIPHSCNNAGLSWAN